MDSDLEAAIARRAQLLQEIEKLDKLIELWSWWRGSTGTTALVGDASTDSPSDPQASSADGTEGVQEGHASPAEVVRESLAVLVAADRPMKRGALLTALSKRGVKVGGTDKSKVLGTTLWRAKDQFVSLPGWGYWIKDRPYPPALYDPAKAGQAEERDPFADLLG